MQEVANSLHQLPSLEACKYHFQKILWPLTPSDSKTYLILYVVCLRTAVLNLVLQDAIMDNNLGNWWLWIRMEQNSLAL